MANRNYQPAAALWHEYRPADAPHAFRASTAEDAVAWQISTRGALAELLGFQGSPRPDPSPAELEVVEMGAYTRLKIRINTAERAAMPFYLLLPNGAGPHPVAIALHGHGYGVKEIVGLWEDGSERQTPEGYHRDFAVELALRGFAVAAPEIACFGERRNDYGYLDPEAGQPIPTSCEQTAALALHLGGTVAGLRVRDTRRLIDYLESRSELDTSRLGCMGISGGGMLALFTACLDERVAAAVISGYFSTFAGSVLAMRHCPCNIIPGLAAFGEMADLAGLIAPRPLFVEAGDHDPIFPLPAVREGVAAAEEVYATFGVANRIEHEIFEGRHRINGAAAYEFLRRAVGSEERAQPRTRSPSA